MRKTLRASFLLLAVAASATLTCFVIRTVGVRDEQMWVMVGAVATALYTLSFIVTILYAVGQLREAKITRNAELFLNIHQQLLPRQTMSVLRLIEKSRNYDYAAFVELPEDQQDTIIAFCMDGTMMGQLLRREYIDRALLLDWCAPYMAHARDCLEQIIAGLRDPAKGNIKDVFLSFDYLREEARQWERKHGRDIDVTFPITEK